MPILPRTRRDWKAALAEVKDLYLQKQYKQCAVQAKGLLKNKKQPVFSRLRA